MSEEKSAGALQQMVSFKLSNEEFGVDIVKVQEIMRLQEITKVPQMPDYVEGVINLRGNVIPIIDLRKKFGLEVKERDNLTRIVVVNVQKKVMGFIVDAVEQVLRLSQDQVEPAPDVGMNVGKEYLKGVGKLEDRLLILLDLDKLISTEETEVMDNIGKGNEGADRKANPEKKAKSAKAKGETSETEEEVVIEKGGSEDV